MKKTNRVVGILGVGVYDSNFNADFEGDPRSDSNGFSASHVSYKYLIRRYMELEGHDVFYKKTTDPKTMNYLDMKGSYEKMFGTLKKNDKKTVTKNLLSCTDIHNFGTTFATQGNNIGVRGAVQLTYGRNMYEEASIVSNECLTPFANSEKEDAQNTTLGVKSVLDEAHFFFGFTVNPHNYDEYIDVLDDFEGYEEEMYQAFKRAALSGVSLYASASKTGCENEFGLFINFKDDKLAIISNLHLDVDFRKEGKRNVIDLTKVFARIDRLKDDIESIEIFYDDVRTDVIYPVLGGVEVTESNIIGGI